MIQFTNRIKKGCTRNSASRIPPHTRSRYAPAASDKSIPTTYSTVVVTSIRRTRIVYTSGFFACRSPKIAGMLCVLQDFGAKTGGRDAAEMCPAIDSAVPQTKLQEMLYKSRKDRQFLWISFLRFPRIETKHPRAAKGVLCCNAYWPSGLARYWGFFWGWGWPRPERRSRP